MSITFYSSKYHHLKMMCLDLAIPGTASWDYWWGHYKHLGELCTKMDIANAGH